MLKLSSDERKINRILLFIILCLMTSYIFSLSVLAKADAYDVTHMKETQMSGVKSSIVHNGYLFVHRDTRIDIFKCDSEDVEFSVFSQVGAGYDINLKIAGMTITDNKLLVHYVPNGQYGNITVCMYDISELSQGIAPRYLKYFGIYSGSSYLSDSYGEYFFVGESTKNRINIYSGDGLVKSIEVNDFTYFSTSDNGLMIRFFKEPNTTYVYDINKLLSGYSLGDSLLGKCVLPSIDGTAPTPYTALKKDNSLYVSTSTDSAWWSDGVYVYNIETGEIEDVVYATKSYVGSKCTGLYISGNVLYVSAKSQNSVSIYDISNPKNLQLYCRISPEEENIEGYSLGFDGERIYVFGSKTFNTYRLSAPIYNLSFFDENDNRVAAVNSKKIKVSLSLSNFYNAENSKGMLVIAKYKENNLMDLQLSELDYKNVGITHQLTDYIDTTGADSIRAYVLDSTDFTALTSSSVIQRENEYPNEYYVDSGAATGGDGSYEMPFNSIEQAKQAVRQINHGMKSDITVHLNGQFNLDNTVEFVREDSGFNGHKVIYKGSEGAVLSGGKKIAGWEMYDSDKNIYRAYALGISGRQLYVDGKRGVRARSEGSLKSPKLTDYGVIGDNPELAEFKNICDLEFVWNVKWSSKRLHPKSVALLPDNQIEIQFNEDSWNEMLSSAAEAPTEQSLAYFENAYELLDTENEFYYDGTYLYYKPENNSDINSRQIIAPVLDELVRLKGDFGVGYVENLTFDGITFSYNSDYSCNRADFLSSFNLRGTYLSPLMYADNAKAIEVANCEFSHGGGDGLVTGDSVADLTVKGNKFFDLSARGFQAGSYNGLIDTNDLYYQKLKNITVTNNFAYEIGAEFYAASAINVVFAENATISNNEIYDVPYSGISICDGFDAVDNSAVRNLLVEKNYIHDYMKVLHDGGAIYLLGGTGGTVENPNIIRKNYLADSGDGTVAVIYCDEGSNNYTISENVIDNSRVAWNGWYGLSRGCNRPSHDYNNRFIHNYTTTVSCYQPDIGDYINTQVLSKGNWSGEALEIINMAGLEELYSHLNDNIYPQKIGSIDIVGSGIFCVDDRFVYAKSANGTIGVYDAVVSDNASFVGEITHTDTLNALCILNKTLIAAYDNSVVGYSTDNYEKLWSKDVIDGIIAKGNNCVYIADSVNNCIYVMDSYGNEIDAIDDYSNRIYADDDYLFLLRDDLIYVYGTVSVKNEANILNKYALSGRCDANSDVVLMIKNTSDIITYFEQIKADDEGKFIFYLGVPNNEGTLWLYTKNKSYKTSLEGVGNYDDFSVNLTNYSLLGTIAAPTEGVSSIAASGVKMLIKTNLAMIGEYDNMREYDISGIIEGAGEYVEINGGDSVDYVGVAQSLESFNQRGDEVIQNDKYKFVRMCNVINGVKYNQNKIEVRDLNDNVITQISCNLPDDGYTYMKFAIYNMVLKDNILVVRYSPTDKNGNPAMSGGYGNPNVAFYDVGKITSGQAMTPVDVTYVGRNGLLFANKGYVFYTDSAYGNTYIREINDNKLGSTQSLAVVFDEMLADDNCLFARNSDVIDMYSLKDLSQINKVGSISCNVQDIYSQINKNIYPLSQLEMVGDSVYAVREDVNSVVYYNNGRRICNIPCFDEIININVHENRLYVEIGDGKIVIVNI